MTDYFDNTNRFGKPLISQFPDAPMINFPTSTASPHVQDMAPTIDTRIRDAPFQNASLTPTYGGFASGRSEFNIPRGDLLIPDVSFPARKKQETRFAYFNSELNALSQTFPDGVRKFPLQDKLDIFATNRQPTQPEKIDAPDTSEKKLEDVIKAIENQGSTQGGSTQGGSTNSEQAPTQQTTTTQEIEAPPVRSAPEDRSSVLERAEAPLTRRAPPTMSERQESASVLESVVDVPPIARPSFLQQIQSGGVQLKKSIPKAKEEEKEEPTGLMGELSARLGVRRGRIEEEDEDDDSDDVKMDEFQEEAMEGFLAIYKDKSATSLNRSMASLFGARSWVGLTRDEKIRKIARKRAMDD